MESKKVVFRPHLTPTNEIQLARDQAAIVLQIAGRCLEVPRPVNVHERDNLPTVAAYGTFRIDSHDFFWENKYMWTKSESRRTWLLTDDVRLERLNKALFDAGFIDDPLMPKEKWQRVFERLNE